MNYFKRLWKHFKIYFGYIEILQEENNLVHHELLTVVENIESIISLDKSTQTDVHLQNGIIITIEEYYNRMNLV